MLTIDPGNAGYFIVPVYNDWTITDSYWDQQTSLNNAQASKTPRIVDQQVVPLDQAGSYFADDPRYFATVEEHLSTATSAYPPAISSTRWSQ